MGQSDCLFRFFDFQELSVFLTSHLDLVLQWSLKYLFSIYVIFENCFLFHRFTFSSSFLSVFPNIKLLNRLLSFAYDDDDVKWLNYRFACVKFLSFPFFSTSFTVYLWLFIMIIVWCKRCTWKCIHIIRLGSAEVYLLLFSTVHTRTFVSFFAFKHKNYNVDNN